MAHITLSVPDELKKQMDEFKIINWSAVAREAIAVKAMQLAVLKSFTKDSELTEEDALRLGRKVNKSMAKKYREMLKEGK